MSDFLLVEAENEEEAVAKASGMPLPEGAYVDDSFEVFEDEIEEIDAEEADEV